MYNTYCIVLRIVLCIIFWYYFKIIQPKSSCIIHNTQYNTYYVLIRIMYCHTLHAIVMLATSWGRQDFWLKCPQLSFLTFPTPDRNFWRTFHSFLTRRPATTPTRGPWHNASTAWRTRATSRPSRPCVRASCACVGATSRGWLTAPTTPDLTPDPFTELLFNISQNRVRT